MTEPAEDGALSVDEAHELVKQLDAKWSSQSQGERVEVVLTVALAFARESIATLLESAGLEEEQIEDLISASVRSLVACLNDVGVAVAARALTFPKDFDGEVSTKDQCERAAQSIAERVMPLFEGQHSIATATALRHVARSTDLATGMEEPKVRTLEIANALAGWPAADHEALIENARKAVARLSTATPKPIGDA